MSKNTRTAVLLCSFGTSYKEARENSLEQIFRDIKKAFSGNMLWYQAYTSNMIIRKLAGRQEHMDTVGEALERIVSDGAERLYIVPTHMLAGIEYEKLARETEKYKNILKEIRMTPPILAEEDDCRRLVPVLQEMLAFRKDCEYVLMGHGTEASANVRYAQMNQALQEAGLHNVRIASVEAKPDIENALKELSQRPHAEKVFLHPFMVVAGDHAHNDMVGEEDSFAVKLRDAGYQVEVCIRGLGEYPRFRELYVDRLADMLDKNET